MTKKLLIILEIGVLVFFLFWHFRLGLVRFFDADEFAHLHWGYSFAIGERPYTDFFYLFPPFFLYPIAAIFKIFGRVSIALVNARMFMFFVFLATSGVLFLLVRKVRSVSFALLTLILFAFLPLPFDKMIEVRPDLLATGLSLLGLLLFLKGYEGKDKKYFFLSGLSYAVGLGFVPKTIFFLVPVVIVIGYLSYLSYLRKEKKNYRYFFLGMLPVGLLLFLLVSSFGNLSLAIYSMTRMASEVTQVLGSKFYMRPDIFFYPNDTYYGITGWSIPLIVNLIIYVSASIWAIHRLISSGSSTVGGVRASQAQLATPEVSSSHVEFLIAGSFFANLTAFVYFYPLKHAQYLIPVAPFIAFYFVDLWESVMSKLSLASARDRPKSLKLLKLGMTMILLSFLCFVGFQMNQKKSTWVNTVTMDKISQFLKIIPANEPVYDLTGESMFFHNGYYFCCLPYGQYEEALYFKIPDIEKELDKRGTKYVHLGWLKRLDEIPVPHAKYIIDNFVPVTPDKMLLIKK